MNEQQVRALVRDAVARHLPAADPSPSPSRSATSAASWHHASHAQYLRLVNETDACVIEPAVLCNHCGYCKSHGH
jgi:hypothetical protein